MPGIITPDAGDGARRAQGQMATSLENSPSSLVQPVTLRSWKDRCSTPRTSPATGGSPGPAAGGKERADQSVTAQAFRAYLGLPEDFVHSTKGNPRRVSGAHKMVEAHRVFYAADTQTGSVVRQKTQTQLVLLLETYARHDSVFDSLACVDDQWLSTMETTSASAPASVQRDTMLLLPTIVPVLSSQVHTDLCALALGHLYASIMIRELPQLSFTPAFTHKRAYSIPEFAQECLILAQDDTREQEASSCDAHPGEPADDARWFAFRCFVFVRSRGTVFFHHKRTLASGLWSDPVVLTKGKDPSFDTTWQDWRNSIQVSYPRHMPCFDFVIAQGN
jgi:hypothetical protein